MMATKGAVASGMSDPAQVRNVRVPIRLTVLTGFLGAGKTTILNRLLAEESLVDTAVIVNEFGEASIDHLLVEATAVDGVVELSHGCLCCSVRGELVDTLLDLAERDRPGRPLARVIVETTGLADPLPIISALMSHPTLLQTYALDGIVAVVDQANGARNLAERTEARRQLAVADRIVLTKTDIAAQDPALARRIAALNGKAPVVVAAQAQRLGPQLLNCGLTKADGSPDPERWLGLAEIDGSTGSPTSERHEHGETCEAPHEHHYDHPHGHGSEHGNDGHGDVASFSLIEGKPIALDAIAQFLELLRGTSGDRILRMKAIVQTSEMPERPLVLHGVRDLLHPPVRLPAWPPQMRRETRIVLIGEALSQTYVRDLFAAFTGGVRSDAPDREALSANPLAVPGYSFG